MAAIVSTRDRLALLRRGFVGKRRLCGVAVAQHVTVDESHDVERRIVDVEVVAEPHHRGHGHGRGLQARQDAMLAPHVVGARQHVSERRATQHEPACRPPR